MNDSDSLFILFLIGVALWVGYGVGKNVGAARERKAQELYTRAQAETDPDKREQLLLEWNEVAVENSRLKNAFKKALLLGKRKNDTDKH